MWAYSLSSNEAELTERALNVLSSIAWAGPLIGRVEQSGGISPGNMPFLFEVRVAYALEQVGATVRYEQKAGSGEKSIDFCIYGNPEWLIEVVSLGESAAVQAATTRSGPFSTLHLSTINEDKRQSEEGELIKAIDRLGVKAVKFPEPSPTRFHVVLADMRGYLGNGGDQDDYREMAYGTSEVRPEHQHWWNGQHICGLFDPKNTGVKAILFRQRVHFIGFMREREFAEREIQDTGFYLPNPSLFCDNATARGAFATYPLQPEHSRTLALSAQNY